MPNPLECGRRLIAAALIPFFLCASVAAAGAKPIPPRPAPKAMHVLYTMSLRDGSSVRVYSDGLAIATTIDKKNGKVMQRARQLTVRPNDDTPLGRQLAFPSRQQVQEAFDRAAPEAYAPGRIVVVLRDGVVATKDDVALDAVQVARLHETGPGPIPQYTSDGRLNAALASLGVSRSERLFSKMSRGTLGAMSERAQSSLRHPVLDVGNAYVMELTNSPVASAVEKLRLLPSVAYVSPDWRVVPLNTGGVALDPHNPAFAAKHMRAYDFYQNRPYALGSPALPTNYGVQYSQQSMLNAPGVNSVAAYDEVENTLHELPGTGVRITNVSIGDIMDKSDAKNAACAYFEEGNGPTTVIRGGQRYLDLPTLPLIPVYTADSYGDLGQWSVCGTGDGELDEIGMDFAVMAPLPDSRQRAGSTLTGFGDLLGIAPGASYRLVVPQNPDPYLTDIDVALMAAAQQLPRPDVITASLGLSFDANGFPGRYLGDDPLTAAVIAAISAQDNEVVAISANDGTRAIDGPGNVAIGPSGGAAATRLALPGTLPTTAGDVGYSTVPSYDLDDGNIVAGASTLDDIFSAEPQNPSETPYLRNQLAFAETRWNGFTTFASGFGQLVSLSAPGDNIITYEHLIGGDAKQLFIAINGGTSASAPEIAAGAAVAIQVARAVGKPFSDPVAVRKLLIDTGSRVPNVPQSDVGNHVGPQLNVGHAVETLLAQSNKKLQPSVPRVAVAQRRNDGVLDGFFTSDTDPTDIDLIGPVSSIDGAQTGGNQFALITIAPDWEAMPSNATYRLFVVGKARKPLATTAYARLTPEQILSADGEPLVSNSKRTVKLTYQAVQGSHVLAQSTFKLTFGPAVAHPRAAVAPIVPAVTKGDAIPVTYDISNLSSVSSPLLVVSMPGRVNPVTGQLFHPSVLMALPSLKGTVRVPLSQLPGGGIYGVGIQFGVIAGDGLFTDFAYTRVGNGQKVRANAPLVGAVGQPASLMGHYAELPYGKPYKISWDASNVAGANGAILEVSTNAPGTYGFNNFNAVNNPNGSQRDDNGIDTGSVYYEPLSSIKGTATFTPATLGLVPTAYEQVRVLATKGSTVAGEASDFDTLREDGVVPVDGEYIPPEQFGISANGTTGYFAGNIYYSQSKLTETSLEKFNQQTQAITGIITQNLGQQWYQLPTGALYGTNVGLYTQYLCDPSIPIEPPVSGCTGEQNPNNYIVKSIAHGSIGPVWSMPPNFAITTGATNPLNDEALIEGINLAGAPDIMLALSNLSTNATDKTIDVSTTLGYNIMPPEQSIASVQEDVANNLAVLGCFCQGSAMLAVVNTSTGAATTIPPYAGPPPAVPGTGYPAAMALDTGNDEAIVVPSYSNAATIYNVNTGAVIKSFYLGPAPSPSGPSPLYEFFAAADPVNHVFLVNQSLTSSYFLGDNNATTLMYEIDAQGNIVKTFRTTQELSVSGFPANNLQVVPSLREAYASSADFTQVMPFSY